jgi:6-phosphofructokinase 1
MAKKKRIGVLTSGGDAPGMNAAVRAIVRTAIQKKAEVFVIKEGYKGLIEGNHEYVDKKGNTYRKINILKVGWDYVSGIIQGGGTKIGSARCKEFKLNKGRLKAASNLLEHGIDRLIVIGGDGSLTGANIFYQRWNDLLDKLIRENKITKAMLKHYPNLKKKHPSLSVVGLIASIDNDMCGTNMTMGADTALHRISYAIDSINSTAASHQRTFVVEVMGNKCGYLGLMSALTTGADWVIIPEDSYNADTWKNDMCKKLKEGREAGRRSFIVILSEGSKDSKGKLIKSKDVKKALVAGFDSEVRVTILGHVQRGGSPSAFDRIMSTRLGHAAVKKILSMEGEEPCVIAMIGNKIEYPSLDSCLEKTKSIADAIAEKEYNEAKEYRGVFFKKAFDKACILEEPKPPNNLSNKPFRFAVVHSGAPAPGMNTAVRAAVRLGIAKGHKMFGIKHSFKGVLDADIQPVNGTMQDINKKIIEMDWMSVNGWASMGGANLGTNRDIPTDIEFGAIAGKLRQLDIQGLLIIGGWSGYKTAFLLDRALQGSQDLNLPIVCMPASVINNLPGTDVSVGADTALNNIVQALDRIKQSAFSSRRCFIAEVAGRYCGYLALMSSMATGAEQVYLHEDGIRLSTLNKDLNRLKKGFEGDRGLALIIRNEFAHPQFDMNFMSALFEGESGVAFNVRKSILGHLQHGGDPSPFDRILATRLADSCIDYLIEKAERNLTDHELISIQDGIDKKININQFGPLVDDNLERPLNQWWMTLREGGMTLREIADLLAIKTGWP